MKDDDLFFLYWQLREQLDMAYKAPKWDAERIDRITRDMRALERSLAALGRVEYHGSIYGIAHVATDSSLRLPRQ